LEANDASQNMRKTGEPSGSHAPGPTDSNFGCSVEMEMGRALLEDDKTVALTPRVRYDGGDDNDFQECFYDEFAAKTRTTSLQLACQGSKKRLEPIDLCGRYGVCIDRRGGRKWS